MRPNGSDEKIRSFGRHAISRWKVTCMTGFSAWKRVGPVGIVSFPAVHGRLPICSSPATFVNRNGYCQEGRTFRSSR